MDKCTACGHDWHGLECRKVEYTVELGRVSHGPCGCPSQYAGK